MMLTKLVQPLFSFVKRKPYQIVNVNSETTDLRITHDTGVVVQIEKNGNVVISTPNELELHAKGNMQLISETHIGLTAPRIDLN